MNLAMRGRKGRKLFGEAGSLDLATYANARLRLELNEQAKRAAGGFGPWLKEVTPEWQWEPIHFRYARWYLNKVTHKQIQKLMIFMPPRHGKCLPAGTPVLMHDGTWKSIEDVCPSDMVMSLDSGYNSTVKPVLSTMNNGVRPVLRITLFSGREVTCTENHPFLTVNGWEMAGNLKEGDSVAGVKRTPIPNSKPLPEGFASLIGYMIGDGGNTTGSINITTIDSDAIDHIGAIAGLHGWEAVKNEITYRLKRKDWRSGPTPYRTMLDYVDPSLAADKRVPEAIWRTGRHHLVDFLGAYFNCDGTVTDCREGVAEYYSVSEGLLRDVQRLLTRLGIYSTLRIKLGRYKGEVHKSWRLGISGRDLVEFAENVPVIGEKGRKLRSVAERIKGKNHYPQYDSIPEGWKKFSTKGIGWHRGHSGIRADKNYKRGTARHIVKAIAEIEDNDELRKLCNPDIVWERITKIEHVGDEPTYDIEVKDTHNFIADGIVVHNTEQNTIRYAAYRIELDPTIKVMVVSYNKELASDFSRKIMAIVEQRVELSTKKRAAHKWETKAGGALNAFGVRGVGGGRGYDLIILDDVIKNADEANSPRYRQRMWDSWLNDISKRVNPGCSIIITFTRWHRDDLAGRILESEDAPNWTVVKLAALAEANDPMGRPEGMALWPERWSEEWLRGEQRIDIYAFESLFQQNPTPPGGKMFDGAWTSDCYVDALPGGCRYVRYWDKACLIAGTMIHTSEGQKSIETIRAGDMVLTRQGYKEVQWAGLTGIRDDITSVTFGNGQTVTGTKDHLVWTENRGWVPLAGIMSTDYTLNTLKGGDSWESVKVGSGLQTPRQSSSTALRTLGVLARNTSQRIVGTRNARGIGRTFSIGLCGENGRVKFRKGGKSITRMRTRPITRLITLNASLKVSISGVMACLLNGIRLRKGKNTRGSLTFRSGRMHPIGITFASNVGPHFSLDASTHRLNIARPSAESVTARPVYDIQVKDCHEFFANGVLVHNSTQGGTGAATAGVLMAKTPKGQYIICDVERGRWGSTEREERIKATAFRDGTITEIRVEREPGSSGKESAEATIRNLEGFACTEDRVTGDKVVRAQPLASRCKVGDVKLLKDSPYKRWNGTFLAELEVFPQGQLKDQVDAAAGAYNYLALSDAMGLPVVAQRATVQNHPTLWLPNQELWSPGL